MMPLMRAPLLMALGLLFAGSEAFGKVLKKQVSVALLDAAFSFAAQLGWYEWGGDIGSGYCHL